MKNILLVFIGGGAGSILRYGISKVLNPFYLLFPYATLISNFLASLLLGFFIGFIEFRKDLAPTISALFLAGFCGGFSTFSTFSSESLNLYKSGNHLLFFLNILLNIILCLVAVYAGIRLGSIRF